MPDPPLLLDGNVYEFMQLPVSEIRAGDLVSPFYSRDALGIVTGFSLVTEVESWSDENGSWVRIEEDNDDREVYSADGSLATLRPIEVAPRAVAERLAAILFESLDTAAYPLENLPPRALIARINQLEADMRRAWELLQ